MRKIMDPTPPHGGVLPHRVSAAQIEEVARQLPRADTAPESGGLSCVYESSNPGAVADWQYWTVWQDKRSKQIWVRCAGGLVGADAWFGPGDASLVSALGEA